MAKCKSWQLHRPGQGLILILPGNNLVIWMVENLWFVFFFFENDVKGLLSCGELSKSSVRFWPRYKTGRQFQSCLGTRPSLPNAFREVCEKKKGCFYPKFTVLKGLNLKVWIKEKFKSPFLLKNKLWLRLRVKSGFLNFITLKLWI